MNILQKLNEMKLEFAEKKVAKSGVNTYTGFDYFTLEDITPPILELCKKHGVTMIQTFHPDLAIMHIYNNDKPDDSIEVMVPMAVPEIKAANATQNMGASITYLRRYLYMVALDIIEGDALDATHGKPAPTRAPATKVERKKTKEQITGSNEIAPANQLSRIAEMAKELYAKPGNKTYVNKISKETDKFTNVTRKRAEELILEMEEKLAK